MPTDTTGGASLPAPSTHADGLFPLMSDLRFLFPPRHASLTPAILVEKVALPRWWSSLSYAHRVPRAREPTRTPRTQRHPSNSLKSTFALNILRRTAKFWQSTRASAQSDGWAAAVPHSQLSSPGIWEANYPCQLFPG